MILRQCFFSLLGAVAFALPITADDSDDDMPDSGLPKVRLNASDPVAFRGLSTGAFIVWRDETNGPLVVNLALSGSASNGVDYVQIPSTVTIPAGFHAVGIEIEPLGDGDDAPNKVVKLTLLPADTYRLSKRHDTVVIKGNDFENRAPSVTITSPADGAGFPAGAAITIAADALDANDSVKKVSFYAGDHHLGTDNEAPYSIIWSNVPAGKFSLFARAEDTFGKSALSPAVDITVTNPPAGGGVVLTSPTDGSSFGAPAFITLAAALKDTNSAFQSVSYFAGETLLGSVSNAPFTFVWNNVAPGSYRLSARATETNGTVSTSAKIRITVTNPPPMISILTPTNNTVLMGPADVKIEAEATDGNGINTVMFFGGEKFLGVDKTAPYSLTWSNAPAGKQTITVRAVDNYGASKTASVQILLSNTPPTLNLVAPTNNQTFTARATIELKAEASDPDGIRYVSFWAGDKRLDEDKTAPYSVSLRDLKAGTYTFSAHAVDNQGQRTVSAPVKVIVTK